MGRNSPTCARAATSSRSPNGTETMTIAGSYSTVENDFYVILVGWEPINRTRRPSRSYINPLINLIWWGGIVLIIGTVVAVWHRDILPERIRQEARGAAPGGLAHRGKRHRRMNRIIIAVMTLMLCVVSFTTAAQDQPVAPTPSTGSADHRRSGQRDCQETLLPGLREHHARHLRDGSLRRLAREIRKSLSRDAPKTKLSPTSSRASATAWSARRRTRRCARSRWSRLGC